MDEEQLLSEELEEQLLPTRTYKVKNGRIQEMTDGLDAIAQAVDKILQTERFENVIYSEDYGTELDRFIGQDFSFTEADLERTITDALLVDDRIAAVEDFTVIKTKSDSALATFTVVTVEGEFEAESEVALA